LLITVISIALLSCAIIVLVVYNFIVRKRIKTLADTNQKINSLNVLQDFMNIVGSDNTVDYKLQQINEKLREKFDIKYSTIVIYNGAEYEIKATNVEERHWQTMKSLQDLSIFKESIVRATPKYITVERDTESLPYQTEEIGRAKSAIFFPLYIDNVYIGYWIIESGVKHGFDQLNLSLLEIVKNNIIVVVKTISYQTTMESIVRKDLFTGINSAEFLYGEGKLKLDKFISSQICMFKIANLEEVNNTYNRHTGNNMVVTVSRIVRDTLLPEHIFVRYMGPKFVIVFIGEKQDEVTRFIQKLKVNVESADVEVISKKKKPEDEEKIFVKPRINFVISTYYKGTGVERISKKLEQYLDMASETENDINYL